MEGFRVGLGVGDKALGGRVGGLWAAHLGAWC